MRTLKKINQGWLGSIKLALGGLVLLGTSAPVGAQSVRVTGVSNVSFGTVANLQADISQSQSLCAYSSTASYSVRASGSGAAGAFTLSAGSRTLAYEVQWNSLSGQQTGTSLVSGVTSRGFISTAVHQQCNSGPRTTASLIVALRAASLSSATAGSYSGTLTILLAPE